MTKTTEAELLFLPESEELRFLPEGPTALGGGKFSWVGIQHGPTATCGSLNIFDLSSGRNEQFMLPGRPGFAKPTNMAGVFAVGCERELGLFDISNSTWKAFAGDVDADVTGTVINDGTIYGNNLIFGTKDLEFKTQKAGLYLYRGGDQSLTRLRADQICSNGKAVVDSGTGGLSLIDIDSPTKKVVRYQLNMEAAELSGEETIVDLSELESVPDGMTLTPDGQSMIISFYNPNPAEFGETRQYSVYNGELEHIWTTPGSPQATCPLLIRLEDGSVKLIITTAVEHMPSERRAQAPNAGGLFIADTSFKSAISSPTFSVDSIA